MLLLLFCLKATPISVQALLLTLLSETTPGRLGVLCEMLGIKPGWVTCKANVVSAVLECKLYEVGFDL